LKFPYKDYPNQKGEPDLCAVLLVQIANPVKHSPPSKRFEALIDSGASRCIFHAGIGEAVGFDVTKGIEEDTIGVDGKPSRIYLHKVSLYVAAQIITIRAGFSYELPLAGVLGRLGFFENFKITFDASTAPPFFELERIVRV
jgi:hypothetical protein